MTDNVTDTNLSQVVSSYGDVNTALEKLLANLPANYASLADLTNLQNTINNAGYATEKELIGLADSVPVGTIFAYSSNTIPAGYLLCNGARFDQNQLSDLYNALGSSSVPDTRGLFLRGLDTTGSVDNYPTGTRALLSSEEGSYILQDAYANTSSFIALGDQSGNSLKNKNWDAPYSPQSSTLTYSYSPSVGNPSVAAQTGTTPYMIGVTRPKNIAVNYIIKAYKIANYGYSASALTTQGGTLTGNLVGNKGGTVPQVIGMSGNVSMQVFTVTNNTNNIITFPTPFASGTTPMVFIQGQDSRQPVAVTPIAGSITNTQFSISQGAWFGGSSGLNWLNWGAKNLQPVQVFAIGVM